MFMTVKASPFYPVYENLMHVHGQKVYKMAIVGMIRESLSLRKSSHGDKLLAAAIYSTAICSLKVSYFPLHVNSA